MAKDKTSLDNYKKSLSINNLLNRENDDEIVKYHHLMHQWRDYKLQYDFFILPEETMPCQSLKTNLLGTGYICAKNSKCEFKTIINSSCNKPYSPEDSPIRGKTIKDLADLEKAVEEMSDNADKTMFIALGTKDKINRIKDLILALP